jgi:HEAT repeat protein
MATFALANIGGAEIAGEMAEATKDPAWQVRIVAAEYFGESGDRAALKVLRPLVSDPHGGVRNAAKAAVEKLRS